MKEKTYVASYMSCLQERRVLPDTAQDIRGYISGQGQDGASQVDRPQILRLRGS